MDNRLIICYVNIQQLGEDYMLQQCHIAIQSWPKKKHRQDGVCFK